ncbi:hypothetical protein GH714_031126 [Hevea brasiliensis]|uniref:Serine carboxypeptidase-like 18 n=1 Tax=Hevea brasiliensis TaxID=3981 RepID=A0A6A6N3S3_HEVBR|nr:hypothetical protein GH714_031126 [Hevea brasiliensis]
MASQVPKLLTSTSFTACGAPKWLTYCWRLLLLLVLLPHVAFSGQIVKYLPGFDGELPFKLETGYVSVGDSELFYYFIESQGPLEFDINHYKGGLPKLKYYPYAWTKWLLEHPQYLLVQLFIGGDSYSGITVPLITQKVVEANEAMVYPYLNLKGYLLGSPTTDQLLNANAKIIFAHRMALISDQLYEKLKTSCNDSYVDVDPSNTACVAALGTYEMCIKDLYTNDILEPSCVFASHRENSETVRRSAKENPKNFILSPPRIPELWCRNFNYVLAYVWSNNLEVQDALHARKGAVSTWQRCNQTLSYTKDVQSVIDVHRYLSNKGLEVLVQNGDRDMVVPFVATQTWIKSLNLTISDEWRPCLLMAKLQANSEQLSHEFFWLV